MSFVQLQLRRDTAANWTSNDPTLAEGEVGFETDTNKFKIGDGATAWTSLAYFGVGIDTDAIHDNVAGEIAAITYKGTPVGGDILLIEDSAAGNAKKYTTVTDIQSGGESNDLEAGCANIAQDELVVGSATPGQAAYTKISAIATEITDPDFGEVILAENASGNLAKLDIENLSASAIYIKCTKDTAGTINIGDLVYQSAADVGTGLQVELADSDNTAAMPAIGMALDSFTNLTSGRVVLFGEAVADTTGLGVGDPIYVDTTAGAFTTTRPSATNTAVQKVGTVLSVGVSGRVYISGANRSNDIPNVMSDDTFKIANGTATTNLLSFQVSALTADRLITWPDAPLTFVDGCDDNNLETLCTGIAENEMIFGTTGGNVAVYGLISSLGTGTEDDTDWLLGSDSAGVPQKFDMGNFVRLTDTQTVTNKDLTDQTNKLHFSKGITIEDPTAGDIICIYMNERAVTLTGVSFASVAGTSVAFTVDYAGSIASGTLMHTDTCSTSTAEFDVTPSNATAVPTDQCITVEIGTVTGTVTQFHLTLEMDHT